MKISIQKEAAIEAAYAEVLAATAARRGATERWWASRSPWARFRARCAVLAWLTKVEEAQEGLSAAWRLRI